jgi:hypothetical protein
MLTLADTTIRLGETTDLGFIVDSWARSFTATYPNQYILDFQNKFRRQAETMLAASTILVSVLDDSPDDIVSWLAYRSFQGQLVCLYAYTRPDERRQGFLHQLLTFANPEGHRVIFTYPAKNENAMRHLSNKYLFDPYLLGLL